MAFAVWGEIVSGYKLYASRVVGTWQTPVQIAGPARFFSLNARSGRVVYTDSANDVGQVTKANGGSFGSATLIADNTGTVASGTMAIVSNAKGDTVSFWYQFDASVNSYRPDWGIVRQDAPDSWSTGHLTPAGCNYYSDNVLIIDDDGYGAFICKNYNSVKNRSDSYFSRMLTAGGFSAAVDARVVFSLNETTDASKSVHAKAMVAGADNRIYVAYVIIDGSQYDVKIVTYQ